MRTHGVDRATGTPDVCNPRALGAPRGHRRAAIPRLDLVCVGTLGANSPDVIAGAAAQVRFVRDPLSIGTPARKQVPPLMRDLSPISPTCFHCVDLVGHERDPAAVRRPIWQIAGWEQAPLLSRTRIERPQPSEGRIDAVDTSERAYPHDSTIPVRDKPSRRPVRRFVVQGERRDHPDRIIRRIYCSREAGVVLTNRIRTCRRQNEKEWRATARCAPSTTHGARAPVLTEAPQTSSSHPCSTPSRGGRHRRPTRRGCRSHRDHPSESRAVPIPKDLRARSAPAARTHHR